MQNTRRSEAPQPKKSLGQNFLLSEKIAEKIVAAAEISDSDTILEIGPGRGILTQFITKSPASKVLLCEKDRDLCEQVRKRFENKKTKVICDDALLLIPNLQVTAPFKVISNLPYNISSPCIISLLTVCPTIPETMVLMLQREVADRICCEPGQKNRGLLTVLIELMGEAKIIEKLTPGQFYPAPKVHSAVIQISNIKPLDENPKIVLRIIKHAFSSKRKKIKNSLFNTLRIPSHEAEKIAAEAGFDLNQRPEDLNKKQWSALIPLVKKYLV